MAGRSLFDVLRRLRRRVLCIDAASGIGWGLVAAVTCLGVAVWLDLVFDLPPALRIGALIAAGCAAVVLLSALVVHGLRRSRPSLLARRLDEVGGTGGQILSGVDLADGLPSGLHSHNRSLTGALAGMAVLRAERLAENVPRSRAVPARSVVRAFGALGGLAVLVALLAALMPRLAAAQWRRFVNPFGDNPPFSLVSFNVEPGDASVLYGEGLDVRVEVDGPSVDDVELVMQSAAKSDETLPMFSEPGGAWRVSLANLTEPLRYHVRSGQARSEWFEVEVVTVPRFGDVRFRITPPAYTRRADYNGPLPQGGIAGLPGTRVEVWAASNRPLSGGSLTYTTDGASRDVQLNPSGDGHEVTGSFEIAGSGRISLKIVDTEGQASTESWSAPVVQMADERPFVRLLQPPAMSLATPTATVPVVISAEDDYGVARLQLYRSLNDSRPLPMDLTVPNPHATRTHHVEHLPLAAYGLEPGDEIKLFARVEDNDPHADLSTSPAGAVGKGAESSVVRIRIVDQAEFDRMRQTRDGLQMLMSKYQQARRRTEALAEEMDALRKQLEEQPENEALKQELQEKLEQLGQRMEEEAEALRKLQESDLPFELDKELEQQLEQMENSLQRLSKQTRSLAGSKPNNKEAREQLEQMLKELNEQRERLESEAMQPLEVTAGALKLAQDESRFVELYRRQRDLAERLASLKGRDQEDDPTLKARMRDLEAEQRQIEADLEQLIEDIEEHAELLPQDDALDDFRKTALEFAAELRASGAGEAMTEASDGLAEFSGTRGHAGAKEAADILERFLGKCNAMGMGGACEACRRFSPGLGDCMGQTLSQLMGLKPGQGPGNGLGGSGDGYSARRNSLDNVGMFGTSPLFDQMANSGGGQSDQQVNADGRGGAARPGGDAARSAYGLTSELQAGGEGEAVVPLHYRRKVGRYFQRIADEIGDQ